MLPPFPTALGEVQKAPEGGCTGLSAVLRPAAALESCHCHVLPCRLVLRARSRQTPAALMEHVCQNPPPAPQKPAPALPQKAAPKAAPSDMRHFPPSPWLRAEEHTQTMSQTEPNQTFIHPGQQVPRRSRPQVSQTREQQQQNACPSSSSSSPSCNKTRIGGSPHITTSHAENKRAVGEAEGIL